MVALRRNCRPNVGPRQAKDRPAAVTTHVRNNQCSDWEYGDKAATGPGFEGAHTSPRRHRSTTPDPTADRARAAVGAPTAAPTVTLYSTSQNPQNVGAPAGESPPSSACAPEHKLHIIARDVRRRALGSKIYIYNEDRFSAPGTSKKVKRPGQVGRRERTRELPLAERPRPRPHHQGRAGDGRRGQVPRPARSTRWRTLADTRRCSRPGACPTYLYAHAAVGPVRDPEHLCPKVERSTKPITAPVDAYPRGAGAAKEATYVVERIVEVAAQRDGYGTRRSCASATSIAKGPVPLSDAGESPDL